MILRTILALGIFGLANLDVAAAKTTRPNIVFILADDLGITDLSNEGSNYYESPHIDRISKMGMKFNRGYATCQVCSPSRASILTGKYPVNHGITTWIGDASGEDWRKRKRHDSHLPPDYEWNLRASEHTLAEVLQGAGYRTFFAGKWHLGSEGSWPTDHGFDVNKGGWDVGGPRGGYFAPWQNPNLKAGPNGESLPIRLGQETAKFIESNKDKPFLAYLSFYAVHSPIQTTPTLWKKYQEKAVSAGLVKERFINDRRLPVRQVQDCPVYAGLIEQMDEGVGVVLKKLDELGLTENTIICFTSDNGGVSSGDNFSTSCLPYRGGKGRQWEGGIREPFYLYAPGVTKAGTETDVPASGIDWYPTLLELAGVSAPKEQQVDGISLLPLLKGEATEDRALYWHYPHYGNQGGEPSSIIMEDQWKLIYYHEDGRHELYNIEQDPGERRDVMTRQRLRTNSMKSRLRKWLLATRAKFPTKDPQFDPEKRAAYLENVRTKRKAQLEKQHAYYVAPNYRPNKDWWGSVTKD